MPYLSCPGLVSDSYRSTEAPWMWQRSGSLTQIIVKNVETPSGQHALFLRCVSFSVWGKATHRVSRSHNEPLLRQTKRDETICSRWRLISLTVEISVSFEPWESIYSIQHDTTDWEAKHSYEHLGFVQACGQLADYLGQLCWFDSCYAELCLRTSLKNSGTDTRSLVCNKIPPAPFLFSITVFFAALYK